jgi:hypothetical protein
MDNRTGLKVTQTRRAWMLAVSLGLVAVLAILTVTTYEPVQAGSTTLTEVGCTGNGYTYVVNGHLASGTFDYSTCTTVWLYPQALDGNNWTSPGYQSSVIGSTYWPWDSSYHLAWGHHQACHPATPCTSWQFTSEQIIEA